jgi:hypothetical protein
VPVEALGSRARELRNNTHSVKHAPLSVEEPVAFAEAHTFLVDRARACHHIVNVPDFRSDLLQRYRATDALHPIQCGSVEQLVLGDMLFLQHPETPFDRVAGCQNRLVVEQGLVT